MSFLLLANSLLNDLILLGSWVAFSANIVVETGDEASQLPLLPRFYGLSLNQLLKPLAIFLVWRATCLDVIGVFGRY